MKKKSCQNMKFCTSWNNVVNSMQETLDRVNNVSNHKFHMITIGCVKVWLKNITWYGLGRGTVSPWMGNQYNVGKNSDHKKNLNERQ